MGNRVRSSTATRLAQGAAAPFAVLPCIVGLMLLTRTTAHADPASLDPSAQAQTAIWVSSAGQDLGPGASRFGGIQSGTLRQGQSRPVMLAFPANRCFVLIARAMPSIQDLDLSLERGR